MIYTPRHYQNKATEFILKKSCCGVFADPGLGKTAITLDAISSLKMFGDIKKTLIIAPIKVIYNVWPKEIEKWDNFNHLTFQILHGKDKEKNLKKDADIYLINPENFSWILDKKFDMLVIDESTKFKNPSSKRFKNLKKQVGKFKRRVILTGTPTPNSYLDLFSQIFIVDAGKTFGKFITHYRNNYFNLIVPKIFKYKIKDGAEKIIQHKIKPLVMRLDAKKLIDLPKLLKIKIGVSLQPEVLKKYKTLEKRLFLELGDKKIFAASAGVAFNYCNQFANGAIYNDKKEVEILHKEKINALVDLISELQNKPLFVLYRYKHDKQAIKAGVGGVSFLTDKPQHNNLIINQWNGGELPVLAAQMDSAAHGLNLQGACQNVCFYSLTANFETYEQSFRRVYRSGVSGSVRVFHIVTLDTIDNVLWGILKNKEKNQEQFLESLNSYLNREKF